MSHRSDASEKVEQPKEQVQGHESFADVRAEAYGARVTDPKVDKLEHNIDEKISGLQVPEADKKIMKDLSHDLAEGNMDKLKKDVEKLDAKTLARIAPELAEAFHQAGMATNVRFDSKGQVLEIEDQRGNNTLMIPREAGKPAMGNSDGVHFDDYEKDAHGRIKDNMTRTMLEVGAGDAAKDIQKHLLERNARRPEPKTLHFD